MARDLDAYIDPQLQYELSHVTGPHKAVAATITLRSPEKQELTPASTESLVRTVLDRIGRRTQCKPNVVNVFPNIQSFAIEAPAVFVEELLNEREIDSAMANQQKQDMRIQPLKAYRVPVEEVEGYAVATPERKRRKAR